MNRSSNPLVFHTVTGLGILVLVMVLIPEGTAIWRRILAGIFGITLGHSVVAASLAGKVNRVMGTKAWLASLAFPFLIAGVLLVPAPIGWMLLVTGFFWRPITAKLWK